MAGLESLHFLRPAWLLALPLLPALLWLWRRQRDAAQPWRAACDPHLLPHLLQSDGRGGWRGRQLLAGLGFALAVLALAGPAFRQLPQPLTRAESALVVALDLSDRMRATDLKPDRLSRARYLLAALLRERQEGQTALLAYAGDAFVVAPLTDDAGSLSDLLAALAPETLPVRGQRADRALRRAAGLLRDAGFARGEVLLVTDRVESRDVEVARQVASDGLRVSVLGVGTEAGAPVALPQGGFAQDEGGQVLLPRLEEAALRELANAGAGRYVRLRNDGQDLARLALSGTQAGSDSYRRDERTQAAFRDEGPWLVLLLLPLAALAFRRGWLACLPLGLCLHAPRADALDWSALWQRQDQRAWSALQEQDAARALALARDPAVRGSAAYRAEDYASAEQAFAAGKDADAHYNRGNALAKAQRYEEALRAYDQALALAPDMPDALANRQAVADWLKRQAQPPQQEPGESGKPGEPGEPGESPPSAQSPSSDAQAGQEPTQGRPQAQDGPPTPDATSPQDQPTPEAAQQAQAQQQFSEQMEQALQQEQAAGEATSERVPDPAEMEKQQAVEQWLRRVPDDPGGLLRRKFALEYQRRRREGEAE